MRKTCTLPPDGDRSPVHLREPYALLVKIFSNKRLLACINDRDFDTPRYLARCINAGKQTLTVNRKYRMLVVSDTLARQTARWCYANLYPKIEFSFLKLQMTTAIGQCSLVLNNSQGNKTEFCGRGMVLNLINSVFINIKSQPA